MDSSEAYRIKWKPIKWNTRFFPSKIGKEWILNQNPQHCWNQKIQYSHELFKMNLANIQIRRIIFISALLNNSKVTCFLTVVNRLTTSIECRDISILTSTEKYLWTFCNTKMRVTGHWNFSRTFYKQVIPDSVVLSLTVIYLQWNVYYTGKLKFTKSLEMIFLILNSSGIWKWHFKKHKTQVKLFCSFHHKYK